MRNARNASILLIICCLSVSAAATIVYNRMNYYKQNNIYREPLLPAPYTEDPLSGIKPDFTIDESAFSSHLPILVIDTDGVMPPITTRLIPGEGRYARIEGIEPYVDGVISVIDSGGINRLDDSAVSYLINLKRRGNSSMSYEKAQYLLKTVTESGQEHMAPLLGMPAECEWVLNGSMVDKSMLRDYLVYRIGSEFMPFCLLCGRADRIHCTASVFYPV